VRLHEYQAKRILAQYEVPVPAGEVATSVAEVQQIAERIACRVVLKAQVLTGGRGQAGGVRLANDPQEAGHLARQMFGMRIAGLPASKLLVDQAVDVDHEFYLGISLDRGLALPIVVASSRGGIDIAQVTRDTPQHVYRVPIDPLVGLRAYQVRALAEDIGLEHRKVGDFVSIALGLYGAFVDNDAILVEANPLVVRPDGRFCCLNSKMVLDDNALFRHPHLVDLRDESQDTLPEQTARRHGITYVRLGGHVGCMFTGAGLAMASIDQLRALGVRPANFVDVGKGATADKVVQGLLLARNNSIKVVLVNAFCSVASCDEIARGIVEGCAGLDRDMTLVVRLDGAGCEAGWELLEPYVTGSKRPRIVRAATLREVVTRTAETVQQTEEASGG
jgi:succinyl-CoA synthetase beta subunit